MTDHQLLAQAEVWRTAANESRRFHRSNTGKVSECIEMHCLTLEGCAARLEKLVKEHPEGKIDAMKQHLVNQTDFIVQTKADLGLAQGLALTLGYKLKTTKIDQGWMLVRLYP